MIFQYTGQPGHGKTVLALQHLLKFKSQGREVYATNVRKLDYDKAGIKEFSPEEFRDWPNQLPTGSVLLVDECYEHDMLPKRRPGSTVPEYVKQLAKHRHLGYDFIFVCQSPTKQMDEFVHDLIEEHYHVRRRFGLPLVHVRRFDKYERNPEKSTPLSISRRKYPKEIFQLYESTKLDTAEARVPWFYYAAAALIVFLLVWGWITFSSVNAKFTEPNKLTGAARTDGASATAGSAATTPLTNEEYLAQITPRFPALHGSQPIFDKREAKAQPRTFCVISGEGRDQRCACYTEQVTKLMDVRRDVCEHVALNGQYDPFLEPFKPGTVGDPANSEPVVVVPPPVGIPTAPGSVGTPSQGNVW